MQEVRRVQKMDKLKFILEKNNEQAFIIDLSRFNINTVAKRKICKYVKDNYFPIKIEAGKCRYNFRCHLNAVNDAIESGDDKIAMCVYIDEGYPVIHFLNYKSNTESEKFIDNTLGHWCKTKDYYFVRFIESGSFFSISSIFKDFRKSLCMRLPWIIQKLKTVTF